jgi:prolyl oligopeptidase
VSYPDTHQDDVVDTFFGVPVADPYRWLEDDRAPAVEAWVKAQNEVTQAYLGQIPFREDLESRLAQLLDYPKLSSPRKIGDYYFFYKNDGLQNQAVIYYQQGLDGDPQVFMDPNALSEDGTVAIGLLGASPDDRYLAYSRSEAGSDWQTLHVVEIATRRELDDVIPWVKFSGTAWYQDGFFYSGYPAPEQGTAYSASTENQSVYYHRLGSPVEDDVLIYHDPAHPNRYHNLGLTEDKAYMILYARTGTDGFETYVKETEVAPGGFQPLYTGFAHKNMVLDHWQGHFLVMTDVAAPNYRVVKVPVETPDVAYWQDLIPEREAVLEGVSTAGEKLFAQYLDRATSRIYQIDYDGTHRRELSLPGLGTAGVVGGKREDRQVFYSYSSYTTPPSIYRYEIGTGESTLFFQPTLHFDPSDYEAQQVVYQSKDGTEVSMFVVHQKGLPLDGQRPTYLYGYGGFNISLTPGFSASIIALLEQGGVFAVPNLRGGGEYGEAWHQAGMLFHKQSVFDDFIAAAEFLIAKGYTSTERLAIAGGSNGGLLVGACMTQRPDLFRVVFPAVGVLDMLRYHRFTVGWGWVPEYGSADSSQQMFEYLYGYSPLHQLEPGVAYPATLVTTADHDDRVVPAHSFKFAARLQAVQAGPAPVLIRIETDAGHGAGKPITKVIEEQADKWAFLFTQMGIVPQLAPRASANQ